MGINRGEAWVQDDHARRPQSHPPTPAPQGSYYHWVTNSPNRLLDCFLGDRFRWRRFFSGAEPLLFEYRFENFIAKEKSCCYKLSFVGQFANMSEYSAVSQRCGRAPSIKSVRFTVFSETA